MTGLPHEMTAAGGAPRRLFFYNAGILRQPQLRRLLTLAGHEPRFGLPQPGDAVGVWGRSPYAARGEAIAARRGVPGVRLEDAFLRSIQPGRRGGAGLGLLIDPVGVHFDSSTPSALERILTSHPLDDSNLLMRARDGIQRISQLELSKYNIHDPTLPPPAPGHVLVVDQTRGDASIRHSGASETTFREMLVIAQEENPGARIVIKTHPETALGLRGGHFSAADATGNISLLRDPVSPYALLAGAIAVYTVSSQLGFEAIMAGHRPRVFGQPFYAGWGLTLDERPVPRRKRVLTRTQLFAAAMILAPVWFDPCRNRLCRFEEAVDQLEAETRAFREDRHGHVALGMRLWKRGRLQQVFGQQKPLIFTENRKRAEALAQQRGLLVWAGKEPQGLSAPLIRRVEDGFLRSRGLGAELIPPLSLVTDDLGIYYDPSRESRLERLILSPLPDAGKARAAQLMAALRATQLTKYNLGGALPDLPPGHRILVPGQVEDDASIRLGAGEVRSNLALLQAARAAHPDAVLVYKPHPDVEAGLRPGAIRPAQLAGLADVVATAADPIALMEACDEVWTMTSLLGFEALLRGKPVTTLGAPFYAGWGLTRDIGLMPDTHRNPPPDGNAPTPANSPSAPMRFSVIPERRLRSADGHPLPRPSLEQLVHAALIAYPRYYDPVSRRPCPVEVVVTRLSQGGIPHPGAVNRIISKLQGLLASRAHLWR